VEGKGTYLTNSFAHRAHHVSNVRADMEIGEIKMTFWPDCACRRLASWFTLIVSLLLTSIPAEAQVEKIPRVGFLCWVTLRRRIP
jgi:hypothetical protein